MRRLGGLIVGVAVLALCGCTAPSDDAAEECLREAGTVAAYRDAHRSAGSIDEVQDEKIIQISERVEGNDQAHDVTGQSRVRIGSQWTEAEWECFSQVADGKRFTAMVSWR